MHGMVWDVVRDRVDLGEAGEVTREFVRHPGAVAVRRSTTQGRVCLIQQYRHPVRAYEWEIPAGLLDVDGEPPHVGARQRELPRRPTCVAGRVARARRLRQLARAGSTRRCGSTWPATSSPVPEADRHAARRRGAGYAGALGRRWTRPATRSSPGGCTTPPSAIAVLAALAARDQGWATLRPADAPWPSHPAYRSARLSHAAARRMMGRC